MHKFSEKTIQTLQASGWQQNREVEIEPFIEALNSEDYSAFPVVQELFKEFGGLQIEYIYDEEKGLRDMLIIDPVAAASCISPETVRKLARTIGKELCIIGVNFGHDVLLMSKTEMYTLPSINI